MKTAFGSVIAGFFIFILAVFPTLATTTTPTCTTLPVGYIPGDVLIDELFYDPDGPDSGYEYIILYNATDGEIDLTGWEIQWGGSVFTYGNYSIPSVVLGAGEDLLIGGDLMSPVPDIIYNFNFQNGGSASDGVRITDGGRTVNDTVIYGSPNTNGLPGDGDLDPYPDEMCAPDVPGGKVLVRDELHTDTDDCAADFTEDDPIGGCEDADGDGYDDEACGGDDCDDTDPDVNPGAAEGPQGDPTCSDLVDNDCDDDIDEADSGCTCWDGDGDGYLDEACGGDDCDDGDPAVNPGAMEGPPGDATCTDLADNDCDEYVDDADPDCVVSEDDTIYQLQNTGHPEHILPGSTVTVEGVIVTGVTVSGHFFVEEPAGGQWSGVYVYDLAGLAPTDLAIGDELSISGTVDEYFDLTEIKDLTSVVRTGQGVAVPAAVVVDACDIATGGTLGENYEGVLVRVENVEVTNPDLGYGEFELDVCLRVDDLMYLHVASLGEAFESVTGIHNYGYGDYKLEPRDSADLVSAQPCIDADEDGYDDVACGGDDCDDTDVTIHPDAVDACDGVDQDCDGIDGSSELCTSGLDEDCDGLVDAEDSDCPGQFTLELDASYAEGTLSLAFTLGTPEPAMWANYLILIEPTFQVIPLWTVPLPVIDPPISFPISFPLPSMGLIGIWTGLFTAEGAQAADLVWVDTEVISTRSLPDTGIELCYDDTDEIPCPAPGEPFYGQDAQCVINPMSFSDHGDGSVMDNVTGLMWQQEDDDVTRGWGHALAYCKALELAGHTDWRLPDEYELQGIVNYGRFEPAIDTTYFPGTNSSYYWSSSTDVGAAFYAWRVGFISGSVPSYKMLDHEYVRCVRGESIAQSFTDHGDGTVTDNVTGLMWQQTDDDMTRDWEDALAYCEELDLAGYTDWRLPDVKKLRSIVDNTREFPAIDATYFPGTEVETYYWSSSTKACDTSIAWKVYFGYGYVSCGYKTDHKYVRCVR